MKFACPRLPKGSTFEPDPLGLIRTRLAKRAKLPASRACCSWVPALPSMLEKPTTPTGFQLSSSSSQVEELYSAKELTMFCHWRNPLLLLEPVTGVALSWTFSISRIGLPLASVRMVPPAGVR